MKYKENQCKKAEFIKPLAIELVKWKPPDIEEEEVMQIINNIRKYLINRNDMKMNQQYLGFKVLFRGYVIKV